MGTHTWIKTSLIITNCISRKPRGVKLAPRTAAVRGNISSGVARPVRQKFNKRTTNGGVSEVFGSFPQTGTLMSSARIYIAGMRVPNIFLEFRTGTTFTSNKRGQREHGTSRLTGNTPTEFLCIWHGTKQRKRLFADPSHRRPSSLRLRTHPSL